MSLPVKTFALTASQDAKNVPSITHFQANPCIVRLALETGDFEDVDRVAVELQNHDGDEPEVLAMSEVLDPGDVASVDVEFSAAQWNQPISRGTQNFWLVAYAEKSDGDLVTFVVARVVLTKHRASQTTPSPPEPVSFATIAALDAAIERIAALEEGGGGGGGANLSASRTATTVTVASDSGTDATLPAADASNAGVLTASDKSKLDAIEAGATADQTAAEILTLIKTVDGHTSGLDADTIDGLDSMAFANADDVIQAESDIAALQSAMDDKADLDINGKVPLSQLPESVVGALNYQGGWNASANSPTLSDETGSKGDYYVVTTGGIVDLGSGSLTFAVGDWAVHNGTNFDKLDATDQVSSVAGKTGVVTLAGEDIASGTLNNARLPSNLGTGKSINGVTLESGGSTSEFLNRSGAYSTPSGGGGVSDGDKGDVTVSGSGASWTVSGVNGMANSGFQDGTLLVGDGTGSVLILADGATTRISVTDGTHTATWDVGGLTLADTGTGNTVEIVAGTQTGNHTLTAPDKTGTLALVADVTDAITLLADPMKAGLSYCFGARNSSTMGSHTLTANVLRATPFVIKKSVTIDLLSIRVTSALATKLMRIGIYADDGNCYPGALVSGSDLGTYDLGSTGVKSQSGSIVLAPGLYWIATAADGAAGIRGISGDSIMPLLGWDSALSSNPWIGYSVAFTFGALPSTFTGGAAVYTASAAPAVLGRAS